MRSTRGFCPLGGKCLVIPDPFGRERLVRKRLHVGAALGRVGLHFGGGGGIFPRLLGWLGRGEMKPDPLAELLARPRGRGLAGKPAFLNQLVPFAFHA